MKAYADQFTTASSGTTDIVVHPAALPFDPSSGVSVLILWAAPATGELSSEHSAGLSYGFGVSSTVHGCVACCYRDSVDGTATSRSIVRNNACLTLFKKDASGESGRVAVKTWDSNGFTLSVGAAFNLAYKINYVILNGFTNATVQAFGLTAIDAADQVLTGFGFQPDFAVFAQAGESVSTINSLTSGPGSGIGVGATTGTGAEVAMGVDGQNPGTSNQRCMVRTDVCVTVPRYDSATERLRCNLKTFDSGGLTITVHRSAGTATVQMIVLATKGGSYKVGTIAAATAAGNFSAITGLGFTGVFLQTFTTAQSTATQTTGTNIVNAQIGGAAATTQRGAAWMISPIAAQDTADEQDSSKCYIHYERDSADTFTVKGAADFVSFGTTVTLNQTTADATAVLIPYFLIGPIETITGDAAVTEPMLTLSAAGTLQEISGDAAVTEPMLTLSATGDIVTPTIFPNPIFRHLTVTRIPGVAYRAIAPMKSGTSLTIGVFPAPILCSASLTLPILTLAAAGAIVTITGSAAVTVPMSTLSATGAITSGLTGNAAITEPMSTLIAYGQVITPPVLGLGEDDWFFRRRRRAG